MSTVGDISAIAARAPVIPVLTIETPETAVPLARALVRGGLPVLEITLRTAVALEALRIIVDEVPEAIVGAGTVLDPVQLDQVQRAGARFAVSPGCTEALARAARSSGIPFLPGVQTVSEAMTLAEHGFEILKFFPADAAGGLTWIKAVGAPLSGLRFCPTGGVTAETVPAYLALPNVACVGGSWVAPRVAVATGDWQSVERLAAAASTLKRR
ncbi:bifunctional 4-hydroxy-2-oxoglutarate aldolase/2-dehydro-3-deoxy-phosphogluconate aldolase [Reyranella sp.]|uniref:bifunctional 4-hydroxy-2-oxoglutarate aldolase/2-dehydro-3-deoxy-phosphogluconate aldolase n=1 Tax=Reyranella sp. TaxID=1929291 RepID=UPI00263777DE|nr:bifunctional 4-hydroxy-2-oxoglutarate aldolase/2-dehydro-3-deoxy-phosphogluconate aldolase [Reyranella sp.]HQS15261.1 bifunctional 4-hydroxy-2-oxoglutarate aldolase/2-dehydro-3-deoxy-phosphogluconate aldolase [Reyranella sp.]HQT11070.1 bifunctional 4-hydroxy-2-oxoglutarate aldolase/2-dehydro-3-deoxy-phosphogluconate aldolase [Reyranella sp.]